MSHKVVHVEGVDIDPDLLKKFEDLQDAQKFTWTPEKDTLLIRYWNIKRKEEVAFLLGCARSTAKLRYDRLTKTNS